MKTTIISTLAIILLAFTSCQNDNGLFDKKTDDDLTLKSAEIAETDIYIETLSEEAGEEVEYFTSNEKQLRQMAQAKGRQQRLLEWRAGLPYRIGQCPDVSIDTSENRYPITITLNYGDGTELKSGRIISGIMVIEISGPRLTDGTTRMVTYNGYQIDSLGIEGILTHTFTGDNETSRVATVTGNLQFTMPDGTTIDRTSEKTREWIAGLDTPEDFTDDTIEVTGFVDAENSDGTTWSKTILEPLVRIGSCRHFVQGKVQYSRDGEIVSELDFGEGECDNLATITINGFSFEIDLSGRRPHARLNS
ncbi:MAG: hypothetical protein K9H26_01145 [Prolixibacteraceae bacterium]|nr:hypothetical protein [Prolixibacteraceae bacterium]